VLLVRLGALGDIIHAVPAALALSAVPGAEIDWLVDPRHRAVLDLFDLPIRPIEVGRVTSGGEASDDHGGAALAPPGIPGLLRTIRSLRRRAYDVAVDFQGLMKSATFARLSGARRVIGFARDVLREPLASLLYTESIDPGVYGHVIQKNVALAGAVGAARAPTLISMPLKPDATPVTVAPPGPYAILNPGAGWPNKQWGPDRFGAVADRLRREHGLAVAVTWGPGEEPLARAVVEASSGAAQQAPPTTLPELLALVRRAQLVVSGDTGPLHLAAAAATPIVGVFGPTDPRRNGPWMSDDVSVSQFHQCICHHKRQCSRSTRCLDDISVDDVMRAVEVRLARAGAVKR
jgi:lipopolysaccharide heptosyltransferase I